MTLEFRRLHPHFFAAAGPLVLRASHDADALAAIRAAMDAHAVIVFHDQTFTDAEQLDFARRLDGVLHAKTGARVVAKNRLGEEEALTDISNVSADGALLAANDRQRLYRLGNRLWHTDASFEDPAGRYSMLHARVVPPAEAGGDTEFADMRAAYDALSASMKARLEGLRVRHSIAYSRQTLGFEFSPEEAKLLPGAEHPLHVAGDPLTRRPRRVRPLAGVLGVAGVAGVDQHGRAVREDHQRRVTSAGDDLMQVERAGRPRRQEVSRVESRLLRRRGRGDQCGQQRDEGRREPHRRPA